MGTNFVAASLAALTGCADENARLGVLRREQRRYLDRPDEAAVLARCIAEAPPAASLEDPLSLLTGILDEARMADENGLPQGTDLLGAVAAELARLTAADTLSAAARFALAQAYIRAGLEPPPATKLSDDIAANLEPGDDRELGQRLSDVVDHVRAAAGDDPLQLHAGLAELLATLPAPAQAVAITEMAALPQGDFARLGAYWLLDRAAEVRQAAAAVILGRARTGVLTGVERTRLITVRRWLPADAARALVDDALREALRREPAAQQKPPMPWKLHRGAACLPDGAGAQSLTIVAQQGGRRAVAVLLLKAGHGVKDAFVVACKSATEQKRLLAQITKETDPLDVDVAYIRDAIGRALGDGAAHGHLPAPGLIDVAEILGNELAPTTHDAATILTAIDQDGALAALSPQKRSRLVGESASWSEHYALVDTWFEDTGSVRKMLDHAGSRQSRRAELWRHLETRRDWWAAMFAWAAATLKAARDTGDAWRAFAATGLALLDGRPLKKVPIMETIVEQTLDASNHRRLSAADLWDDEDVDEPLQIEFVESEPERPGEVDAYLASAGLTAAWLDGWLVAVAVAPRFERPGVWIGPLLERLSFADANALQRFLDLLMARMNVANAKAADAKVITQLLQRMSAQEQTQWAAGFSAFVTAYPSAWPRRGRTRDDQAMLTRLAQGEAARLDPALSKLLGTWISQRHARRAS